MEEDVHTRVMYDDITECFWQRRQLALMLPAAYGKHALTPSVHVHKGGQELEPVALGAYAHFRGLLIKASEGEGGAKKGLRDYFGKTYYEKQGWAHCFHVFGRVFMWHSVAFHLGLALTFRKRGEDASVATAWDAVSTVYITHAIFKIVRASSSTR